MKELWSLAISQVHSGVWHSIKWNCSLVDICFMQVESSLPWPGRFFTSTEEYLVWSCICFEFQSWLMSVPTRESVPRMLQTEPRDWILGNPLYGSWISLLLVTLHRHRNPENQGYLKDASWLGDIISPCLLIFEETSCCECGKYHWFESYLNNISPLKVTTYVSISL